ncbi:hypothetical protein JCM10295v2_004329 [Rhodotorula toruloides]
MATTLNASLGRQAASTAFLTALTERGRQFSFAASAGSATQTPSQECLFKDFFDAFAQAKKRESIWPW